MSEVPQEKKFAKLLTRNYLICPNCGERGYCVDHRAKPDSPVTWPEDCTACDHKFQYTLTAEGELTYVELPQDRIGVLCLLEYHNNKVPLRLVVESKAYKHHGDTDYNFDKSYWFNEHTCPTNFFDVVLICDAGDLDPHGVFQLVRSIRIDEALVQLGVTREKLFDCNNEHMIAELFPELLLEEGSGDTVIEGEVNATPLQLGNNPA